MRCVVSIFGTILWVALAWAQSATECAVCQSQLEGPFYIMNSPLLPDPQPVCEACTRLEQRCFECSLPVKIGYQRLPDGRFLCRQHLRTAVLSTAEAEALFKEVKRDLLRMFSGTGRLPDESIGIQLVDRVQLRRLLAGKTWINAEAAVAITETTQAVPGQMRHQIYVLTGLSRAHFAAVAAHEYGHTWVAENVTRSLSAKTVEGFCELVAYNLMTERKDEIQKKVILSNAYTEGQIDTFREAGNRYQFHRVVDWMKRGQDSAIGREDQARWLALTSVTPQAVNWQPEAKTPVPDQLELRGISGTAKRRFALVNDCTLEKNEQAKVRVGTSNVVVRCLDITDRGVVLKVLPGGEIKHLSLPDR